MRPDKPASSVQRAKRLRRELSKPEAMLWSILKTSPGAHKFRKQHPAGPYVLDFFCARANLAIEIDGYAHDTGHRPERDAARDQWLAQHRIATLRIAAVDVLRDPATVAESIVAVVEQHLLLFGKSPHVRAASPSEKLGG